MGILYKMDEAVQSHEQAPASSPKKKGFFKQKGVQIGLGSLLIIALLLGGYFFIAGRSDTAEEEETNVSADVVQSLTAEELGLSIEAKPDNKAVKFKIEKAGDIKTIEYQLTYEADSTAQERAEGGEDRVQRGVTGEADVKSGATSYESEWLDLGSCSRNVCKYDAGVESVELTLKIVKKDGKTYESSDSLALQ